MAYRRIDILNCKHEAKIPNIDGILLLLKTHRELWIDSHDHSLCTQNEEGHHKSDAEDADRSTKVCIEVMLCLESEFDFLTK